MPFETAGGKYKPRYYQANAIDAVLNAVAEGRDRILFLAESSAPSPRSTERNPWRASRQPTSPGGVAHRRTAACSSVSSRRFCPVRRGGVNDEPSWRGIPEHFSPAVQLGLTATPKRKHNVDTYAYFGEPVY